MTSNDRNYQLQGSYTRYYDGYHSGFDSEYGPSKRRNFKTFESAVKAAKKELKRNERPAVVKAEKEQYGPRRSDYRWNFFAEDGHEFQYGEKYECWHVDGVRIVDRETQKVLWVA